MSWRAGLVLVALGGVATGCSGFSEPATSASSTAAIPVIAPTSGETAQSVDWVSASDLDVVQLPNPAGSPGAASGLDRVSGSSVDGDPVTAYLDAGGSTQYPFSEVQDAQLLGMLMVWGNTITADGSNLHQVGYDYAIAQTDDASLRTVLSEAVGPIANACPECTATDEDL